ncbi:hypothetical protein BZA05DRAFT_253440 [Tricharina praecox]|uniref:uncharacterized protein n=1 Tax=Tricharina praecox TaxID=43433 RepID=UPI00221FB796|nr:uncharacterized protein BZA05DRAFT_253440 [Tricharina praecox]KAI5854915.1 hypothetical protein BZA05DRAFT_253440 [Tricharina praecox]
MPAGNSFSSSSSSSSWVRIRPRVLTTRRPSSRGRPPAIDDSQQWTTPSNGRLPAMDDSQQWTTPSNGRLPAMDDSQQWTTPSQRVPPPLPPAAQAAAAAAETRINVYPVRDSHDRPQLFVRVHSSGYDGNTDRPHRPHSPPSSKPKKSMSAPSNSVGYKAPERSPPQST